MKNLVAGENIILPNTSIRIGVHVSALTHVEMDLLALPLSFSGQSVSSDSIIHSGKKYMNNGAIILSDGRDNNWLFEVNLPFLPASWHRVLFTLIFKTSELAGQDKQIVVTIEQIANFIIPGSELTGLLAIRLGELYRYRHTYKFRAFGDGYNTGSEQVARSHGLEELPQVNPEEQPSLEMAPAPARETLLNRLFNDRLAAFTITTLGPQGVGKTSLLASMCDQLNRINCLSPMKLITTPEATVRLKEHVQHMIDQPWARGIQSWPESVGTAEYRAYPFQLISTSLDFQLNIQFADFPGRYLQEQPEQIIECIRTSHIILLVIDTPALIAEGGRWHETVNAGRQITDLFKHALREAETPKLLLMVPVKCEHYLHYREYQTLLAAAQKEYAGLINFLGRMKREIAVAITPVQTLGGVHCVGCLDQDGPVFLFEKRPDLILYSPRDVEQPLLYSLSFMLRGLAGGNRRFTKSELREHLEEVIGDFLQHRKQGAEGYRIIQGARLL